MRIGGFANLKVANVAHVERGKWVAKAAGRTVDKGPKIFSFVLHPRVRELLAEWLNCHRVFCDSAYLFPGHHGPRLSTDFFRDRFARLCTAAGLTGPQFHPHALRHVFAHMLLALGNSVDVVSKLMGHAFVSTTEIHYLKASAAEVSEKAIVPWITKPEARSADPVPSFLRPPAQRKRRAERLHFARQNIVKLRKLMSLASKSS
jgi:integrase/recombinase XerD